MTEIFADYDLVRETLAHCADDLTRGGVLSEVEVESHFGALGVRIREAIGNRPAALAVEAAREYLRLEGGARLVDRYHFEGHAPICGVLTGRPAVWHEATLSQLQLELAANAKKRC